MPSFKLIALALPLALSGCYTTGEPEGGPVLALVGPAGQPLGQARMW